MAFPLTNQIYQIIIQSPLFGSSVQVISTTNSIDVADDAANASCEIGISKCHYLRVFLEGHKYFRNEPAKVNNPEMDSKTDSMDPDSMDSKTHAMDSKMDTSGKVDSIISSKFKSLHVKSMSDTDLVSCYLATISILMTTHEYSSVWLLHEKALMELQNRNSPSVFSSSPLSIAECDYKYLLALATSRLDRINKSSMLWHCLRRSSVQVVFSAFDPSKFIQTLSQILRSMTIHLANYSAGYTFLWMVQMAQVCGYDFDKSAVLVMVRGACRASLGDISLWTLYGKLLSEPDNFSLKIFNDSAIALGLPLRARGDAKPFLTAQDALDEIKWLLSIDCQLVSPYMQFVPYLKVDEVEILVNAGNTKLGQVLQELRDGN